MKKISTLYVLLVLLICALSCQKSELSEQKNNEATDEEIVIQQQINDTCGEPLVKQLMDVGGVIDWGNIVITNDDSNITIRVNSEDTGMYIQKITAVYGSQQHVSDFLTSNIFWTACDGPSMFDRQKTFPALSTRSDTIQISNDNFQDDSCIWIHLSIDLRGSNGTIGCSYADPFESPVFGSAQYQSAFQYCRQDCVNDTTGCDTLRTQTPGGWGAPPNGNNPGAYLHANFTNAFPNGVAVGCYLNNYFIHLTSAQAITDLLPTGGQAEVLTQNYTNPVEIKNVLVGHLVALSLSVGFDAFDSNFGGGSNSLGSMYISDGTFKGWTVSQYLAEANKVLGGCSSAYTAKQVLKTAEKINENYVDGKKDNGFLVCESVPR
jgi:hypothetical protein